MDQKELDSLRSLNTPKEKDTLAQRILFGQFLVNKGYISLSVLNEAMTLQEQEGCNMKIGEVLLKHFGVFKDENELFEVVAEFYSLRESLVKERKRETEKYTIKTVIEDVDYFLNQYSQNLNLNTLDKAILILESEREYRMAKHS